MTDYEEKHFVFEFYKLKSVSWKANLMTQKCRPSILLCLVSVCLPEIIVEFWLLLSLLTVCMRTLIILEMQLY